jgi:hypothetical protein
MWFVEVPQRNVLAPPAELCTVSPSGTFGDQFVQHRLEVMDETHREEMRILVDQSS